MQREFSTRYPDSDSGADRQVIFAEGPPQPVRYNLAPPIFPEGWAMLQADELTGLLERRLR